MNPKIISHAFVHIPEHTNQTWKFTTFPINILLVDQKGRLMGKPWMSVTGDYHSEVITGIYLGYEYPSIGILPLTLRNAAFQSCIQSKLDNSYLFSGYPENIMSDCSIRNQSDKFIGFFEKTGIKFLGRSMFGTGDFLESYIETLKKEILSELPGFIPDKFDLSRQELAAEAKLSIGDLEHIIRTFTINVFNQNFLRNSNSEKRIEKYLNSLPSASRSINPRTLDMFLFSTTRKVLRDGWIKFCGLPYKGEKLKDKSGSNITVYYTPADISEMYAYSGKPEQNLFIDTLVPRIQMQSPQSLYELKAELRELKKMRDKSPDGIDETSHPGDINTSI